MLEKYVIGLDISTHTGICLMGPEREVEIWQIDATGFGMWRAAQMIDKLNAWLVPRIHVPKPRGHFALAVVEQAAYGAAGGPAHNVQNELNAIARFWLHTQGIESVSVAPNTIKKFATGNGRADKAEVWRNAEYSLNMAGSDVEIGTDNEADAYWLARFGWEVMDPQDQAQPGVVKDWTKRNFKQLEITRIFQ